MRYILVILFMGLMLHASFVKENNHVIDKDNGLSWQDSEAVENPTMLYTEAVEYCEALKLDEQSDWRLPTLIELQTIVDLTRYEPALQRGFHFGLSKNYWTSTLYADDKDRAWQVDFKSGASQDSRHSYDNNVRCVRSVK